MDLLKQNSIKIVGRLINAEVKTDNRKSDGVGYVSATATIISNLDGRDNEFEVQFYSSALTADGKENQLYKSYVAMEDLKGKKVEINGDMRENRFYSVRNEQMGSAQVLNGRFIRGVSESTIDCANFELGGFVVRELVEKKNKAGEIYRYDLGLGQANYKGDMMALFTLHVDPIDVEIVNGVKGYKAGQTVKVNGDLRFIVETVEATVNNEGGFGTPVTRVFTNKQKNFYIKGGSAALSSSEDGYYDREVISNLTQAYKAHDVELENAAKQRGDSKPVAEKPSMVSRQTSLI